MSSEGTNLLHEVCYHVVYASQTDFERFLLLFVVLVYPCLNIEMCETYVGISCCQSSCFGASQAGPCSCLWNGLTVHFYLPFTGLFHSLEKESKIHMP